MKRKIITGELIILIICWAVGIPCFIKGMEMSNYTESDVGKQWSMSKEEAVEEANEEGDLMFKLGIGLILFGGMQFAFFHALAKEKAKKAKEQSDKNELDNISKLKELLDSGAITKEEFEKKKGELLEKIK